MINCLLMMLFCLMEGHLLTFSDNFEKKQPHRRAEPSVSGAFNGLLKLVDRIKGRCAGEHRYHICHGHFVTPYASRTRPAGHVR